MIWRNRLKEVIEYMENAPDSIRDSFFKSNMMVVKRVSEGYVKDGDNSRYYPDFVELLKTIHTRMFHAIQVTKTPFINYVERDGRKSIDKYISFANKITVPGDVGYIEPGALRYCINMKELEFEEGIRYIPVVLDADYACQLEKLVFPRSLKEIADNVFYWCENLEEVIFKNENTKFSASTFRKSIWFKTLEEGMLIKAGTLFWNDFDEEHVVIPEGVKHIGPYVFEKASMKTLKLPQSLQTIRENAFWVCKELEKVVIPEEVTYIGDEAFGACENLKEVYLPRNVRFEIRTFYDCKKATIYGYKDNESLKDLADRDMIKVEYLD